MLSNQKQSNDTSSSIRADQAEASDPNAFRANASNASKANEFKANDPSPSTNDAPSADSNIAQRLTDLRSKLEQYAKVRLDDGHDWVRFYRFNHIVATGFITKAKIYLTIFVVFTGIWSSVQVLNGEQTWDDVMLINGVAVFSLLVLLLFGNVSRRIVCFCYADPKHPGLVRIAHFTFFGGRQDRVVKLSDISALSDTNVKHERLFFKLVIHVDGKNQTFFLANGKLATIDDKVYNRVFGSLK